MTTKRKPKWSGDLEGARVALTGADTFALDTECLGRNPSTGRWDPDYNLDPFNNRIIGASFATDDQKFYFSFVPGSRCFVSLREFCETFQPILADSGKIAVFQNEQFDRKILSRNGLSVTCRTADTRLEAWLLNENRELVTMDDGKKSRFGLKKLVEEELGIKMNLFSEVDLPVMVGQGSLFKSGVDISEYGADDAFYTLALHRHLIEQIVEEDLEKPFWDLMMPMPGILAEMELRGVMLDEARVRRVSVYLEEQIREFKRQVYDSVGFEFDIASSQQVSDVLFRRLGITSKYSTRGKSGFFSTAADVLKKTAEHVDHPALRAILMLRGLEKQLGTYGLPFVDHAKRQGDGRIRSHYKHGFVETGRLSCADPNMQNLPRMPFCVHNYDDWKHPVCEQCAEIGGIRDCIVSAPGFSLIDGDYCLTGDTQVETIAGTKPISDVRRGDKVFTYRSSDGRPWWGLVEESVCVGKKRVWEVEVDTGHTIRGSADHRLLLRDGSACRIRDLRPGMRLMPFRRGVRGAGGREHLYCTHALRYSKTAVVVADAVLGARPDGHHIHHLDGNSQNDLPENLAYVHRHIREHSKFDRPRHGKQPGKFCSRHCWGVGVSRGLNHQVVAVRRTDRTEVMYDIQVSGDHNFALSCGVISHNSQLELRIMGHHCKDPEMVKVFLSGGDIHQVTAEACKVPRNPIAKCIDGSTLVVTPSGPVEIRTLLEGVPPGDAHREIEPVVLGDGRGGWVIARSGLVRERRPTKIVVTRMAILICTDDHRVQVLDPHGFVHELVGPVGWEPSGRTAGTTLVEARDLVVGMALPVARVPRMCLSAPFYGISTQVPEDAARAAFLARCAGRSARISVTGCRFDVVITDGPGGGTDEVLAVLDGGLRTVYDFHVDSDSHLYLQGGLTAHNNINFGLIYGMGAKKLVFQIWDATGRSIPVKEAEKWRRDYFLKYQGVKNYHRQIDKLIRDQGFVYTLGGRKRRRPDGLDDSEAFRELMNAQIQGGGSDVTCLGMKRFYQALKERRAVDPRWNQVGMVMQVHDEVVSEAPDELAEECKLLQQQCMANVVSLNRGIPLLADCHVGKTWIEAKGK